MCEKQDRIDELEKENRELKMFEAKLFKELAEGYNFKSQTNWRPWQVVAIPLAVSIVGALGAIIIAIAK